MFVEKGGEIIPKIVGVDVEARGLLVGDKVRFIRSCPECGTPLMRPEGEAAHYCPNEAGCPPQIKGKIEHFVTRRAMNINMGPETVEDLYEAGYIKDTADLYTLEISDLLRLERWADKSARNLMASLEESKQVPSSGSFMDWGFVLWARRWLNAWLPLSIRWISWNRLLLRT